VAVQSLTDFLLNSSLLYGLPVKASVIFFIGKFFQNFNDGVKYFCCSRIRNLFLKKILNLKLQNFNINSK